MRVRVLGPVRVGNGGVDAAVTSLRQRRLLAALAASGGAPVPADTLIDVAWGDRPVAHPAAALHTQLSRLRALLGPAADPIRAEGLGYRLALERDAVDAWRFEDLVGADGCAPVRTLGEALALWGGGAFADADDHPAVQPVAARLEELRRRAVEDLAVAHVDAGHPDEALAVLGPLVADDPFRERARAVELRALYAAGRGAEALARYRRHRRLLAEELGTRPSPLLRQVVRAILDQRLPTESVAGGLPPRPVTSFVGRDDELDLLVRLLRRARLVSVLGPAGVGKTRLALHACHALRTEYEDGVWWCDLAQAAPGEVATVVAARLGVHDRAGVPLLDRIASVVGHRRALVVLDNCEHVLPEAGALVDALVRRGDGVVVLATSRGPLGVDGEHRVRLAPLPIAEDGPPAPAVRLFLDRARAVDARFDPRGPSWSATVELCRRVGGLPLALELAAACVGRLDVAALTERVGGQLGLLAHAGRARTDRHGSLVTVLDSAYRLLPRDERALLDRLSVFAGPFDLDTVEALEGGPEAGRRARVSCRQLDGAAATGRPLRDCSRSVARPRGRAAGRVRDARPVPDRHAEIVVGPGRSGPTATCAAPRGAAGAPGASTTPSPTCAWRATGCSGTGRPRAGWSTSRRPPTGSPSSARVLRSTDGPTTWSAVWTSTPASPTPPTRPASVRPGLRGHGRRQARRPAASPLARRGGRGPRGRGHPVLPGDPRPGGAVRGSARRGGRPRGPVGPPAPRGGRRARRINAGSVEAVALRLRRATGAHRGATARPPPPNALGVAVLAGHDALHPRRGDHRRRRGDDTTTSAPSTSPRGSAPSS